MSRHRLIISLLVVAASVASGQAPTAPRPRLATCGRDSVGLGRVTGKIVADSAGLRVANRAAVATGRDGYCLGSANAAGEFTVRGLPPGEYAVTIGAGGASPVDTIHVRVTPDTTPSVTFHLRPENRVNECTAVPECAALLVPPPAALVAGFSEAERVREAMYRMAIAMTRSPSSAWRTTPPTVYCLGDENPNTSAGPAMVEAVKARVPSARGLSGCTTGPAGRNSSVIAVGSTDRAYRLVVRGIVITGDRATASANGGGVSWACVLERTALGWRPVSCKTTGMS